MAITIPDKKGNLYQANNGELSGNIFATWNMDLLSNPSRIRVSPQTQIVMSSDSAMTGYSSSFGLPVAFIRSNADGTDVIWAATVGGMFKTTSSSALTNWRLDGITNSPTEIVTGSDMVQFNSALLVLRDAGSSASLARLSTSWNRNWWVGTIGGTAFTTAIPHPLCVSFNNLLLIGNGNYVAYAETDGTFSNTRIILGTEYEIQWIRSSNSQVYIGARSKTGGKAKVFVWDGFSENFNWDYKLNGSNTFAGVIKNEICHTVDETGQVYAFTGGGFTPIAQFPNFISKQDFQSGAINKNGMVVSDNRINILTATSLTGTGATAYGLENMRSGVWCLDPKVGLHHRYSLTTAKDYSNTITGRVDYGQPSIESAGAIFTLPRVTGELLMGAALIPNQASSSNKYALVCRDLLTETTSKLGYFITPRIYAGSIEEEWQKIIIQLKKLLNSGDKVVVKYRTDKTTIAEDPTTNIGTWVSPTYFTSTATLTAVSAGNEVEVIEGEGGGLSSAIASITNSGSSYGIILNDSVTGASGGLRFAVWDWTTAGTFTTQGLRYFDTSIGTNSSWIQFKIIMNWSGMNELENNIIYNEPKIRL